MSKYMNSLAQIRDDYICCYRPGVRNEAAHFATGGLIDRVRRAALARTADGRKHKHQWRIPPALLAKFADRLIAHLAKIGQAKSFAELLAVVESARLKGVSELTIYDTAFRIGMGQGLEPQVIYLHAGTRKGAARLGWNVRRASIPHSEIPPDLAGLSPAEIEDLLCSYARYFGPKAKPFQQDRSTALPRDCALA